MNNTALDEVHIVRQGYDYKIIVNGMDIGKDCCIDDKELVKALTQSGEFYPFTCNCGYPECAGIEGPVYCQKTADTMTWHKKYPAPVETFIFKPETVLFELKGVLQEIFNELFEQYGDIPWHENDFPHGPLGTSLITLRQALEHCRKFLHMEAAADYRIKDICLCDLLEKNCTPDKLIPALKTGNIHEKPGMQNEEPIHAAAWHNSYRENINLLLMRGADINGKDEYEETPLFYAVKGRYPEIMIPHLLSCGADIEARNDLGQTPFLTALDYLDNPIPALTILKNHNCNLTAQDYRGYDALEYVTIRKHSPAVAKLLTEWGCQRNAEISF